MNEIQKLRCQTKGWSLPETKDLLKEEKENKGIENKIFLYIMFKKWWKISTKNIVSLIFLIFIDIESSYFGNYITKYK